MDTSIEPMNNGRLQVSGLVVRVNLALPELGSGPPYARPPVHIVDVTILEEKTESLSCEESAEMLFADRQELKKGYVAGLVVPGALALIFDLFGYREWGPSAAIAVAIAGILFLAGALILNRRWTIEKEPVQFGSLPVKKLALLRFMVRQRMAEQCGCIVGWPSLEGNLGGRGYRAAGDRYSFIDPEELAGGKWVVDPLDSRRRYHKDYDKNHPAMPFMPRA